MAKRPEKLWEKAFASLKDEDKPSADPQKLDKRNFLLDLTNVIEDKRQECVDREWRLDRSNGAVSVREVFGKMVAWINKFKEVGDIAIQYDPVHAALPWAAVRLVLVAVVNEYETNEALLEGLEYVSSLIARYAMVEALYLNQASVANDQLSEAIIRLYSAVLLYLAKANSSILGTRAVSLDTYNTPSVGRLNCYDRTFHEIRHPTRGAQCGHISEKGASRGSESDRYSSLTRCRQ